MNSLAISNSNEVFALITGASQGLGKAFAFELAKRNINLLLAALPNEGLDKLAEELKRQAIRVEYFEIDLADQTNIESLATELNIRFQVFMLINNAGIGGTRSFHDVPLHYLNDILNLNINALVQLTRLLLPNLKRQKKAYVLNISSMAAFSPIGFKTVYPASKAFVKHFSLGLREELQATNISVSVVYPGPMKTNFDTSLRIERQGIKGKMGLLSTEEVARIAIDGAFGGKANIIPGLINRLSRWLMAILPERLVIKMVTNAVSREL